jgi:hypothetical protein
VSSFALEIQFLPFFRFLLVLRRDTERGIRDPHVDFVAFETWDVRGEDELVTVVDQIDPHRRRFHLRETDAVEIPRSRNILELPLETFKLLFESFEWIVSVGHNALHGCSGHPQIVPSVTG